MLSRERALGVREKLEVARKTAELYPEDYAINVEALERVQPVDLTAAEIGVKLGSVWVPQEDVQDFVGPAFCAIPRSEQLRQPGAW